MMSIALPLQTPPYSATNQTLQPTEAGKQ